MWYPGSTPEQIENTVVKVGDAPGRNHPRKGDTKASKIILSIENGYE